MTSLSAAAKNNAKDLLSFIDASPSPWHAVSEMSRRLNQAGFIELTDDAPWALQAGGKYWISRGGSALIAFVLGTDELTSTGFTLVGAHTDSPGLRLKPKPAEDAAGIARLGVEVYGGPILATFSDRDLSLAGRVHFRSEQGLKSKLLHFENPMLRLGNLAIHMNRDVNENGLKFNRQTELPLLFGVTENHLPAANKFRQVLADKLAVNPDQLLTWDLAVYDTQPGQLWGVEEEFIANSQLDNLASCHAGLLALINKTHLKKTAICAFFDHEEVGSESAVGAGGSFLQDVLAQLTENEKLSAQGERQMLAKSFFISADMAHAWHPNYPSAYEPCHRALVNAGPVIKSNSNQRYTTDGQTAAQFIDFCTEAGVPWQQYSHRSDLGCGSTIGPTLAARLGVPAVDVGCPMWAMHSIRESAGVMDQYWMQQALTCAFNRA